MPTALKSRSISSTRKSIRRQAKRNKIDVAKSDIQHLKKLLTMLGLDAESYDFSAPFMEVVTISPRVLKHILKSHNNGNRTIDRRQVDSLYRSMKSTGYIDVDPFLFDYDGNMINGQHRITAAIKADISITVTIKFNMPPETRLICDNGRRKRPNDALAFLGVNNGEHILSIYKGALDGHNLDFKNENDWAVACCPHLHRNTNFPADELLDIYHRYQDAFDFVTELFHSEKNKSSWSGNSSIKGAFFRAYLFNPIIYTPILQEIIRYKVNPSPLDNIDRVRLLGAFDGKIKKAGMRNKVSQTFCYALTESLILAFAKPTKQLKNIRICPVLDESFPFPALDWHTPGKFISGPEKRRLARLENQIDVVDDID